LSPIEDVKVRPVWVSSFEVLIMEAIFGRNCYEQFKNLGRPFHFGDEAMPRLCDLLNTDLESDKEIALSLDWSAFDANIPSWLMNVGLDLIEHNIDFSKMTVRGDIIHFSEKKAERYKKAFRWLRMNLVRSKIMLPNGKVFYKYHGLPSGSYFT